MAWSVEGAENMAFLRAIKANGESIHSHYLSSQEPAPAVIELQQEVRKELKRLNGQSFIGKEYLNNVPLMNCSSNLTRAALKGLKDRLVI